MGVLTGILSVGGFGQSTAAASSVGVCNVGIDQFIMNQQALTYWRSRHQPTAPFQMDIIRSQAREGRVAFGSTATYTVNKVGDIAYFTYLVSQIPAIKGVDADEGPVGIPFPVYTTGGDCAAADTAVYTAAGGEDGDASVWLAATYKSCFGKDILTSARGEEDEVADPYMTTPGATPPVNRYFAYWTNAIGQFLVKKATFLIGSTPIDHLYSDYLYMWEELSGRPGKRLTEMIGKRANFQDLILDSAMDRVLYTPLPFYWTRSSGNALPLASLNFTSASVQIEFAELQKCIVRANANTKVVKCSDGAAITSDDLNAVLETTQVYLDQFERDRFASSNFDVLITQVQQLVTQVNQDEQYIQVRFNHAVIELIWAVRRACNDSSNNWFDYRGVSGMDPIYSVSMDMNGTPRFPEIEGQWFRLVQPYQFHSTIPDQCIYCYSFALAPQEINPSGSTNFSRFETVGMKFKFQNGLVTYGSKATLIMFARSFNIVKHREGVAGPAYT